jgi:predicted RNA-binding protein associated with RNAse of E/G family
MIERWEPGTIVALRYITRAGAPGMTWPCRVVEDRDDLLALYVARGSTYTQWGLDAAGNRGLVENTWRRDVLRLMYPGEPYSIWLFWESEPERHFTAYYVNFEEPFRRTSVGVDTNDHTLDIVVAPDLTWRWKDSEEFDERIRTGLFSPEFGAEVRASAEPILARIAEGSPPFDHAWCTWSPEPHWVPPRPDASWPTVPATIWPRSAWAYLDAR